MVKKIDASHSQTTYDPILVHAVQGVRKATTQSEPKKPLLAKSTHVVNCVEKKHQVSPITNKTMYIYIISWPQHTQHGSTL